jgi:hypothetical protein
MAVLVKMLYLGIQGLNWILKGLFKFIEDLITREISFWS